MITLVKLLIAFSISLVTNLYESYEPDNRDQFTCVEPKSIIVVSSTPKKISTSMNQDTILKNNQQWK